MLLSFIKFCHFCLQINYIKYRYSSEYIFNFQPCYLCKQDTQLLLWDLVMDELVVPIRRPPGGSPTTLNSGSPSAHWDNISPVGTLQPASSVRDVPKLSPLVVHRSHMEPLSGLVFTNESMLTVCREGFIKIWSRPGCADSNQSSTPDAILNTSLPNEKGKTQSPAVKPSSSISYKAPPILVCICSSFIHGLQTYNSPVPSI